MTRVRLPDHYGTLGVEPEASIEEIKRSFRRLAREVHPDKAGDTTESKERFAAVREAYETLADPDRRKLYDRARAGPRRRGVPAHQTWRPPGGHQFGGGPTDGTSAASRSRPAAEGSDDLDLEDIFGGAPSSRPRRPASKPATERPSDFGFGSDGQDESLPGGDIELFVDLPEAVSRTGGMVEIRYRRNVRNDKGYATIDDLQHLRVPPGTRHGDTLDVRGLGHQAPGGTGRLWCRIRVIPATAPPPRSPTPPPEPTGRPGSALNDARPAASVSSGAASASAGHAATVLGGTEGQVQVLEVSIGEAVLGGRVRVETTQGAVQVTIPPCSSSGRRLRLAGRGRDGGDLYCEIRIVAPDTIDDASRELIRRFAERNPTAPRG